MIVDIINLIVKSGKGGAGCTAFSKMSPRRLIGSGGDGGRGGDLLIQVSPHFYDLSKFRGVKELSAQDGQPGDNSNKKGKDGQDYIVLVPKGTVVRDSQGECIIDLNEDNAQWLACKGGQGGKGNNRKLYTLEAEPAQEREIILDYYIPNDVAIVGLPNSGKTSLLNKLTGKNYKVADYPFTTTSCVWCKVAWDELDCTFLDTPPLKKDEILNQDSFIKHLARSRIVLFLSDNPESFNEDMESIKKTILSFDKKILKGKKIFHLLTKIDTIDASNLKEDKNIIKISVNDEVGIEKLKKSIVKVLVRDK